jgi:catechol 2,3-dioxygenase-like lactoylglutathione lyase family enzyme
MRQQLGWLAVCLPVNDLKRSVEFYEKLDFTVAGGAYEHQYAVMQQTNHEIHLHQGAIDAPILNFRGGDVRAIVAALKQHGLSPVPGHVASDGEAIDVHGCTTACYFDPDGLEVMFDTHPDEARLLADGEPFCTPGARDKVEPGALLLGDFTYCLNVKDIRKTVEFYMKLGWHLSADHLAENWGIMTLDERPQWGKALRDGTYLSLFQGMLPANMLNWRGGDVFAIARVLSERGIEFDNGPHTENDGSDALALRDPDGHLLYFNTFPSERLYKAAGSAAAWQPTDSRRY